MPAPCLLDGGVPPATPDPTMDAACRRRAVVCRIAVGDVGVDADVATAPPMVSGPNDRGPGGGDVVVVRPTPARVLNVVVVDDADDAMGAEEADAGFVGDVAALDAAAAS